jgi:AraC-like DNA-binding protein
LLKPNVSDPDLLSSLLQSFLLKAGVFHTGTICGPRAWSLEAMASLVGMSRARISARFRDLQGLSGPRRIQ